MTELVALPDSELVVVRYLSASGVAHVGLTVPAADVLAGFLPFVRVARRAGLGRHRERIDNPVIDIDVWATTNADVNDAVVLVRALMAAIPWYRDEILRVVVTTSSEITGPQRLPEDDPRLERSGLTVGLTVRPLP